MAIETHPDLAEPAGSGPEIGGPGGVMRPWWLRPGVHTGVIAAAIGYILGHLLGNLLSSDVRQERAVRHQRSADRARLHARHHRLAGRARRVQRPGPADAGQAAAGRDPAGRGGSRPVEVLQVHPGPQGRRHPVPVRHDRLLPDRRPVRDGDQGRAAVADLPPHRAESVPGGGGRARHDDDDDDVLGHPRPVRPVLWPAADRVQAGRVPADSRPSASGSPRSPT